MGTLHCLDIEYGDATVIRTKTATFLVDTHLIADNPEHLPKDKKIRGVFITQQSESHYSGLKYLLKEGYSIDCLIYSPYDRHRNDNVISLCEWNEFILLREKLREKGTRIYSPYRQESWEKPYWETCGAKFWLIGPDRSKATKSRKKKLQPNLVIKAELENLELLFTAHNPDLDSPEFERIKKASSAWKAQSFNKKAVARGLKRPGKRIKTRCNLIWTKRIRQSSKRIQNSEQSSIEVLRMDLDGTLKWSD